MVKTVTGPAHTVTNTYEPNRNILDVKENKAGTNVVSRYDYTVNALGQRTNVAQTGTAFAGSRDVTWGYDTLGQVTSAAHSIPGLDRAYQFDLIGNRLKTADSLTLPAANNYTPNALNQYTAIGSLNPVHDDDGNMISGPLPANVNANSTLVWDGENRLIQAQVTGGATVNFIYDSQSRRIAETIGSTTKLTVYDGWNPIAEYTSAGLQPASLAKSFTWGIDLSGTMQGAGGVGGLLAVTDSTGTYFPTYDGNGNVSEYLNSTGTTVAHYEYDPFGKTTVATGAKANDFGHRFSTKPLDPTTGLYYYIFRWYDPETGRWPSRDPIEEEGGINLYGFVGNNGVNTVDALGLAIGASQYRVLEKSWKESTYKFVFIYYSKYTCKCEYAILKQTLKKEEYQKYYLHYTTDAALDAMIDAVKNFDPTPFTGILDAINDASASITDPVPSGAEIFDISRSTGATQIKTSIISGFSYNGVNHVEYESKEEDCRVIPDVIRITNLQNHL